MSLARVKLWANTVRALQKRWQPHKGQQDIIDDVFCGDVTSSFIRCGRKWGKTDVAIYLLWRIAQSFPNMPCYYFANYAVQARDILWDDPRLTTFGPRDWLLDGSRGINDTKMLMRFKNGSFIKVDGTDNFARYRGVRYKVSVYDEYKDCDPRMRKAMRPNAAVFGGIDIYMGSPPETGGTDYELLDKEHQANHDGKQRAYHAPTWHNPHISKQWLYDEKTRLYRRGEGDEWEREYGAKYVRGGGSVIFPMLDESMVRPHAEVMRELHRDRKKLKWFWWADPAGATCFAVLFVAINPYTKKVYVIDEIYERDQKEMTTKRVGERIIEKRKEAYDRKSPWRGGYDEAATWFLNEWIDNFPEEDGLEPSQKAQNKKTDGLSLIKDIMLEDLLVISDRCVKFYWELDNYQKDKKGKIPKENDHLIDDFRYILGAAYYSLDTKEEYKEEKNPDFRGESLESALVVKDEYEMF